MATILGENAACHMVAIDRGLRLFAHVCSSPWSATALSSAALTINACSGRYRFSRVCWLKTPKPVAKTNLVQVITSESSRKEGRLSLYLDGSFASTLKIGRTRFGISETMLFRNSSFYWKGSSDFFRGKVYAIAPGDRRPCAQLPKTHGDCFRGFIPPILENGGIRVPSSW